VKRVLKILSNIKDEAIFLQIGPWTSYRGLEIKSDQEVVISTFHTFFELWNRLERRELSNVRYLVVSGLLNLSEDEIYDYFYVLYAFQDYVDFLVIVNIGSSEELEKLEKYCAESVRF